ncbi:hypothetical protein D3C87_1777620 [compost metagenome]
MIAEACGVDQAARPQLLIDQLRRNQCHSLPGDRGTQDKRVVVETHDAAWLEVRLAMVGHEIAPMQRRPGVFYDQAPRCSLQRLTPAQPREIAG